MMPRPQAVRLPRRIAGLTSPGARGLRSPSPAMLRSPSPALAPVGAIRKAQPTCPNCQGTSFVEDDGQTICESCGMIMADNGNFANDVTFQETDTGRTLQNGQVVRLNQTHQINFPTGSQAFRSLPRESIATGEKALSEARQIFNNYEVLLGLRHQEKDSAALIFSMAYANGFVRGRTIESVAVVCLYLATRRAKDKVPPYSLMMLDFAEIANINVFDLGKMMSDMVKRLYIRDGEMSERDSILLRAPGAEVLIEKFVKHLDFGPDEIKIKKDATKILQRMKKDWLHDGRRPSGVCGAAVILAARMNNYRRTLREVVLCAKVTEITVKQRLDEFKETDSSKLSVNEFRDDELRNGLKEADPPAFIRGSRPSKKKRGQPSKRVHPETAAEIENEGSDTESAAEVNGQPHRKRARIDADGFAVPEVPPRASQTPSTETPVRRGPGKPKGSKNWKAPPPTAEEIEYENQVEHDIQEALESNRDLDDTQLRQATENAPDQELTPADVAVYVHEVQPRHDPPGPSVWSSEGNLGNINMDETIGDAEFDDDPEVSTCILSEAERELKEKIWVTENAEWLRQDHAKRIRRELRDRHLREQGIDPDELARQKGKVLKRKDGARRSGRVGDVDYLNDDFHKQKTSIGEFGADGQDGGSAKRGESAAADAMTSVRKMFNQRGTFSRRINYQSLLNAYSMPEDSSRSPTRSPSQDDREGSVASSTVSNTARRRNSGFGELFHGSRSSNTRSRASVSQEKRQAREKADRERRQQRGSHDSNSPSSTPAPTEESGTIPESEKEKMELAAKRQRSTGALSPPPTQPEFESRTHVSRVPESRNTKPNDDDLPPEELVSDDNDDNDDEDSPLSSTHTPGGFESSKDNINNNNSRHVLPTPQSQPLITPKPPGRQIEDDVSSDPDDYIDPDDDDNNDDDDDDDQAGGDDDALDAAFSGRYQINPDYQWNDELVEDDDE